ncbi:phosphatase PAP2 family protein [Paenibacillus qinlingensis]|uniref:Membrane-associated phospholipid phosphatase n=1 Tax=Paenibacillus qinlingensis TaxID=1837343 RepID=A0ABU1P188_9BACL|nr:phosphatase PAP2 family protein [Paenibacillus qinlingensis]MDR6553510.1 membrane-associated phospholipid phosphatase [Paenibacillus qinlingensis]
MRTKAWVSYLLACSGLLLIPLVGLNYIHLNQDTGTAYSLMTDLDRQIPFIKGFVVPYLGWYGFLAVGFLYLAYRDRSNYFQTLVEFIIGLLLCYGVYAIYQTTVPRPDLAGSDWLLRTVQWVYSSDEPFNCFPSTHVLTAYLMMRAYLRSVPIAIRYKIITAGTAVLIIASTLFVKQHVIMDIVGAVLVAECVVYVVSKSKRAWSIGSIAAGARQDELERGLKQ